MSELSEPMLEGLRDELRKVGALSPRLHALLGSAGALGGAGAAVGSLLGAGVKGYQGYSAAKEQGGSTGHALGAGLSGALVGAGKGALLGGATGLLGGAATGAARPELGARLRGAVDALPGAHFGQRQVHALTGWTPEKGLGAIGLGAATKKPALDAARREAQQALDGADRRSIADRLLGRTSEQGAVRRLKGASDAYEASQKAEQMGLTNIPGYLKSLRRAPGETLRAAFNDQWKGMSPTMKALTIGVPAVELAGALRSKDAPDELGHSKGERIGRSLAATAGGLLLSPMPLVTQQAIAGGITRLGGHAGRAISRPIPPGPEQDTGQAVPVERNITERAAGGSGSEVLTA